MNKFLAVALSLALIGCQATPPQPVPAPLAVPPALPLVKLQSAAPPPLPVPGVTLTWSTSQDPFVNGYRVYQGVASRVYTNSVGTVSNTVTLGPLARGTTYYFAASSTTASGLESEYSNEVSYTVLTNAPAATYVTVFMQSATNISGPFTTFSSVTLTNPPSPQMFFRLNITNF